VRAPGSDAVGDICAAPVAEQRASSCQYVPRDAIEPV
jgi:hypothetical protein